MSLDESIAEAEKAGMTYGKYMAMKGRTEPEKPKLTGKTKFCAMCGREFPADGRRKYCDQACADKAFQIMRNARYREKCGK